MEADDRGVGERRKYKELMKKKKIVVMGAIAFGTFSPQTQRASLLLLKGQLLRNEALYYC